MTCYTCYYNIAATEYDDRVCCQCPIDQREIKVARSTNKLSHLIETLKLNTKLSAVSSRAKRIFENGNNCDKKFAESLDETIFNFTKKDKYIVLKCLRSIEDCELSRESVREIVEVLEANNKRRSTVIEEWHKFYTDKNL